MMIHEVLSQTGLTRKAIEYYIDQGLVCPKTKENGYREFSEADVLRFKSIAAYRRLDISVSQIREILDGKAQALECALIRHRLAAQQMQKKEELLKRLLHGAQAEEILAEIDALDAGKSIAERLLCAFPGYMGRYFALHFAHFLSSPIKTPMQLKAYETIVRWLDALPPLELPDDLKAFLNETTADICTDTAEEMQASLLQASNDPSAYFEMHEDQIRTYMELRETEEYRSSPAARLMQTMKDFQQQHGYEDVFIPAMERLSPEYAAYRSRLKAADEVFEKKFNMKQRP